MIHGIQKVFLSLSRVDFRKGHDGLLAEARRLNVDPWRGEAIIFTSRCKTKIKILHTDTTGIWVNYKRFENGTIKTKFKFLNDFLCNEITLAELAMLIEGNDFQISRRVKKWKPACCK